jgi:putative flippase GtrA
MLRTVQNFITAVRQRYGSFPIFFVIGGSCGLLDLAILYTLTDVFKIWYLYAGVISFLIISIISFFLHKTISFNSASTNYRQQYIQFLFVITVGIVINNSVLYICTSLLGIWYLTSRIISSLVAMIWNYWFNSRIVFTSPMQHL